MRSGLLQFKEAGRKELIRFVMLCFSWRLQIIALRSAPPTCPTRHTCALWETICCLGSTSCGRVRLDSTCHHVCRSSVEKKKKVSPLGITEDESASLDHQHLTMSFLSRSEGGVPQNHSGVHRRGVIHPEEGASDLGQHPRQ